MVAKVVFKDDFGGLLSKEWSWLREAPGAWRVESDGLHLRTMPGSLWADRNDAKNIPLVSLPGEANAANLCVEVTVTSNPSTGGEQAGLLLYFDDANYVKLVKEIVDGRLVIVLVREENDQPVVINNKTSVNDETVKLRLSLQNKNIEGAYSIKDFKTWNLIGKCPLFKSDRYKVGIFTHGDLDITIERWTVFKQFRIFNI